MADPNRMDRTWLCSVVFMDIAAYSSQSVELQMRWKQRFNGYLTEAIQDVPESERVILDTGDGAAICFLGAPEAAMFAALHLCRSFVVDERDQQPGLRVRIGINLGPVKLVKDINGAMNAIGDGMNAGQRVMSFAAVNQILVSQSFFEVVSRLSDDYKKLFQLKGVERDKHIREHTVYHLVAPGTEKREPAVVSLAVGGEKQGSRKRPLAWVAVAIVVVALAGVGARYFGRSAPAPAPLPPPITAPVATAAQPPAPAPVASRSDPPAPKVKTAPASNSAKAAYDEGTRLLDQDNPAEAARHFSDALSADPDDLAAYVARAEARRKLMQYDLSLADCNRIIQLKPDDPRGHHCRGFTYQLMKRYDKAVPDLDEAIRLNPDFEPAYVNRGTVFSQLEQYDRAIRDFSAALRLRPRNVVALRRRGAAYIAVKQYDKAIEDYTKALREAPDDFAAHAGRARAEQLSGDAAGAAADRRLAQEARKRKKSTEE